ncbi:hypothetical protein M0813_13602 [Anaeramoeba flamelloides]|uniref:Transmembrane protein n=1 Tax=Anaeramoeba flamelloides TaxID=1746091 RepID=A0AAV7ZBM5_9EUKA|nr:hypothetical protein M0812_15160 [Anaeramoeba flamelloides]KAJ6253105.1 hypothetical protein M0813_13602 [Anaeramoeba flamelloides]
MIKLPIICGLGSTLLTINHLKIKSQLSFLRKVIPVFSKNFGEQKHVNDEYVQLSGELNGNGATFKSSFGFFDDCLFSESKLFSNKFSTEPLWPFNNANKPKYRSQTKTTDVFLNTGWGNVKIGKSDLLAKRTFANPILQKKKSVIQTRYIKVDKSKGKNGKKEIEPSSFFKTLCQSANSFTNCNSSWFQENVILDGTKCFLISQPTITNNKITSLRGPIHISTQPISLQIQKLNEKQIWSSIFLFVSYALSAISLGYVIFFKYFKKEHPLLVKLLDFFAKSN